MSKVFHTKEEFIFNEAVSRLHLKGFTQIEEICLVHSASSTRGTRLGIKIEGFHVKVIDVSDIMPKVDFDELLFVSMITAQYALSEMCE